jgi:hypothetical protein
MHGANRHRSGANFASSLAVTKLVFATPRKLPKPADLGQRVVVLDIAFASNAAGSSFEKGTGKFITNMGARLLRWVDHHDSDHHQQFAADSRFVLHTKAQHGACPQIIDQQLVAATGDVDTIVAHGDFDGLASAAKWLRGGVECYPGCDADAFAIDTRSTMASELGQLIDRSLRVRSDHDWLEKMVRFLADGAVDASIKAEINEVGQSAAQLEKAAHDLAQQYVEIAPHTVLVDTSGYQEAYDRTLLLLLGQQQARVAVVVKGESTTFAAHYQSGIDFLKIFNISGGMPTVVSIHSSVLKPALASLQRYFAAL